MVVGGKLAILSGVYIIFASHYFELNHYETETLSFTCRS